MRLIYRSQIPEKITYVSKFVHCGINPSAEKKSLEISALTLVALGLQCPNYLSGSPHGVLNKFPALGLGDCKKICKICRAKLLAIQARLSR